MIRSNRVLIALAVCAGLLVAAPLFAQTGDPQAAKTKFINPLRGNADIQVLKPTTKVNGKLVVTTIQVKNVSSDPIAGLKVEEFWFDKGGNPTAGGDTQRLKKPLMPGETATLVLQDEKDATMFANKYQFSHSYGKVQVHNVNRF